MNTIIASITRHLPRLALHVALALVAAFAGSAQADQTRNAAANNLNLGTAWVSGTAPVTGDVALWDGSSALANTLGGNLTWGGLNISSASGAVAIGGANSLTLDHSTDINTVFNVGANGFTWGATAVAGNFNIRGNAAGTSSTLQGATFAGSSSVTISSTGTKNWATDGNNNNGVTVINFTGTLQLRGNAIPAVGTLPGNWLAFGGGGGAASSAGAAVQTGSFALDTGDGSTCGSLILTHAWSGQYLKLNSLSGSGSIRADWGLSAGTQTRGIELDQAGNTTFSGSILAHNGSSQRRNIAFRKKGAGEFIFTGALGTSGGTASLNFDLQNGTFALGNGSLNPIYQNIASWDTASTFTIASGAVLKLNSAGTAASGEFTWSRALTANAGTDGAVRVVSSGTDGSGYTKGTVALSANNSAFDGTIDLQGGRLRAAHASALGGASSVTVASGAQLFLNSSGLSYSGSVNVQGNGITEAAGQLGAVRFANGGTLSGSVTLAGNTRLTANDVADQGTVSGAIGDGGSSYGIEKTGAGTLTLSGANTYGGATTVSGGILATTTASTGAGNYSVASSATLTVDIAAAGQTLSMGALDFGASGSVLTCSLGTGNPTADVINCGALTLNGGNVTVNASGSGLTAGSYVLLEYTSRTGTGSFVTGTMPTLPASLSASIVDDTANNRILLQIEQVGLKWAVGDGDWDILTANWVPLTGGSPTTYTEGVAVTLNDDASGTSPITISLTGARTPAGLSVNNSTKDYVLTNFSVGGTGDLFKNGSGSLTIESDVNSSGAIDQQGSGALTINGAVTAASSIEQSAGGILTLNGAVSATAAIEQSGAGVLTIGGAVSAATSILQSGTGTLTLNGPVSAPSSIVQTGAGTLSLNGTNSYSGSTTVSAGTLSVSNGEAIPNTATVSIANGATLEVNDDETVAGLSTVAGSTVDAQSGTLTFTTGSILGNLTGAGTVLRNGTADTTFGQFIGTDALNFTGTLQLRGSTPSTSPSAMQGGTGRFWLHSTNGSQAVGTAFALDTGASGTDAQDVIIGDWDGNSGNRKLTLSSLVGYGTLRADAGGTGTRQLVVDQSGGDTTFNGMLLSHNNGVFVRSLVFEKKGSSKLTMAGIVGVQTASSAGSAELSITVSAGTLELGAANTATGPIAVNGGTLTLGAAGTIANVPTITVASGGVFDVSATTFTLGTAQTLRGAGSVVGTVLNDGQISPGTSIDTLTFSTAPTLNGGGRITAEIDRNGGSPLADKMVISSGTLTFGGTLTLTNIGSTLQTGDTFDLFAGSLSGTFATVNLPGGAGHWNTSDLNSGGTITFSGNAAPVAQNFTLGCALGDSVSFQVIGGKHAPTDADGDAMSITAVSVASSGTSGFTASNVTYNANGTTGTHNFTYTVTDALGATDTKTVTVIVSAAEGFNKLSGPTGTGPYSFSYLGIPGEDYALEETPDLPATGSSTWTPVATNTASGIGAVEFSGVTLSYPSGSFRTRHVP